MSRRARRAYRQLTPAEVSDVKRALLNGESVQDIARDFEVSEPTVLRIKHGRRTDAAKHYKRKSRAVYGLKAQRALKTLRVQDVVQIRDMFQQGWTDNQVSEVFGISSSHAASIRRGESWQGVR